VIGVLLEHDEYVHCRPTFLGQGPFHRNNHAASTPLLLIHHSRSDDSVGRAATHCFDPRTTPRARRTRPVTPTAGRRRAFRVPHACAC